MSKIHNSLHFVVDIETLGISAGCPIFQIGAVAQSMYEMLNNKTDIHTFYARPSIKSNLEYGLINVSEATLEWWASQPECLFAKQLMDHGYYRRFDDKLEHVAVESNDLKDCLTSLSDFISTVSHLYTDITGDLRLDDKNVYFWCRGTDFDFPILRHAYLKALKSSSPFTYYKCRDIRTIDNPIFGCTVSKERVAHNALDDSIQELGTLREFLRYQIMMHDRMENNHD